MTFGQRIEHIIKELRMNKNSFSAKLGYTNNTQIGEYIKGTKPGLDFFQKLVHAIPDINLEWLVSGKGEPFNKKGTHVDILTWVKPFAAMKDELEDLRKEQIELKKKLEKIEKEKPGEPANLQKA